MCSGHFDSTAGSFPCKLRRCPICVGEAFRGTTWLAVAGGVSGNVLMMRNELLARLSKGSNAFLRLFLCAYQELKAISLCGDDFCQPGSRLPVYLSFGRISHSTDLGLGFLEG